MRLHLLRAAYGAGVPLFDLGLRAAALWHPKARARAVGLAAPLPPPPQAGGAPVVWFHVASLGEFEQGRPLMEAIKHRWPDAQLYITFFSASGYAVRRNYPLAQWVGYLPADTPRNARQMARRIQPHLAVWVKYDLWLNTLAALRRQGVPTALIAARMDARSGFFRSPLAPLYAEALRGMAAVFTQDAATAQFLRSRPEGGIPAIASTDPRFDRVAATAAAFAPFADITAFVAGRPCVVCGSTWPVDETAIFAWAETALMGRPGTACLIIAPHEIHPRRIAHWLRRYPGSVITYSQWAASPQAPSEPRPSVLVVDNVGMLARLYGHAQAAYVGGGFGRGLHNVLEPAAFGCPVVMGPRIGRFPEAQELVAAGGARVATTPQDIGPSLARIVADVALREHMRQAAHGFVHTRTGATAQLMAWVEALVQRADTRP